MKIIVLGTHFFCVSPNKNNKSINCQQLAVVVVMDDGVLNVNKKKKPNAESKYAAKPPSSLSRTFFSHDVTRTSTLPLSEASLIVSKGRCLS